MTFWRYVRDRALLIAAWLVSTAIFFAIVMLSVRPAPLATAVYGAVLATAVLGVALGVDYWRQRDFYRELGRAARGFIHPTATPVTREQRVFTEYARQLQHHLLGELSAEKEAAKEQQDLTAALIHQMKSPLSVMELIVNREHITDPENPAWQSLRLEQQELARYVGNLLTSARLPGFHGDYRAKTVALEPFLREFISSERTTFIASSVFPELHVEPANLGVVTDPIWLTAILKQLVSNAVKYSVPRQPDGGNTIRFAAQETQEYVMITVSDDGIGIPASDVSYVFEQFFTGENGRVTRVSTGIGLTLAARIAEALDAELELASDGEGTGVTATIRFAKTRNLTTL